MHLVKGNVEHISVYQTPPMFCFGGNGCNVEIQAIDCIQQLYWRFNDETEEDIPVLFIELKNGTKLAIEYDTVEEAEETLKEFMKRCRIKGVKNGN